MTSTIEILKQLGCSEWKNDKNERRMYFNNLSEWYGDLENIDVMQATEIKRILRKMKIYYDVKTGKVTYNNYFRNDNDIMMAGYIFETIKKNIISKFKEVKESIKI